MSDTCNSKSKSKFPSNNQPSNPSSENKHHSKTMSQKDVGRLLDYYRMRIESFEKEEIEWMTKLETLKINIDDYHKKEWELRKLTEEIIDLQASLSETNIAINQERKKVITYGNEIDNYKLKTKEDRRRIIQLLQLAEPIEETIKEFYDCRPGKTIEQNRNYNYTATNTVDPHIISLNKNVGHAQNTNVNMGNNRAKSANKLKQQQQPRKAPMNDRLTKLRTIMFPTDTKHNAINEENAFLKKQLNELKTLYENQILKMEEDRKLREEEFRLQSINWQQKNNELMKKKNRLENMNYAITKDFMDIKYDNGINEKKLNDECELIRLQNEALDNTLKELIKKVQVDKELNKNEFNRKTKNITNTLRNRVKSKEENANIIKEQYKQIQNIYATKVKGLEDQLQAINGKCKLLESRKEIQVDGFINEIEEMRKQLRSYEEYARYYKQKTYGSVDRYAEIQKETSENNDEFLAQTKKTDNDLLTLAKRLKQEQQEFNRLGESEPDPNNRSEDMGKEEDYEEGEEQYQGEEGQEEYDNQNQEGEQQQYDDNQEEDYNNQNNEGDEDQYDVTNDNNRKMKEAN